MAKFTKKELNMLFLAVTGIVHPETEILDNLQNQDKKGFQQILIKLDQILEEMDGNEADKALN